MLNEEHLILIQKPTKCPKCGTVENFFAMTEGMMENYYSCYNCGCGFDDNGLRDIEKEYNESVERAKLLYLKTKAESIKC